MEPVTTEKSMTLHEDSFEEKLNYPLSNFQVAKLLGVTDNNIRAHLRNHKKDLSEGQDGDYMKMSHSGMPPRTVWFKKGVEKLAQYCKSREAGVFLEKIGVRERHISHVESPSLAVICAALNGFTQYKRQYSILGYKVDLYLIDWKIAVECDERGHENRRVLDETLRQFQIERHLGCNFVRFNPDEPNFNIGNVINKILHLGLA